MNQSTNELINQSPLPLAPKKNYKPILFGSTNELINQ
jgi:hypothetical protein